MRLNRRLIFLEEFGNIIIYGVMVVVILVLLFIGSLWGYFYGGYVLVIGISIFIMFLFLMFLSLIFYYVMNYNSKYKVIFRILDYIFIYVVIVGSYIFVVLVIVGGWKGILIVVL